MTPKIIPYNVAIKSTAKRRSYDIPRAYTNDLNSVEFQFTITDMTAEDLATATANVLLYMRDGSFFQNNAASGVTIVGNVVKYTLKENEGNHSGIGETQVEIFYDEVIDKKLASQKYEFEIVSGLETEVAVEVMIQDWTTLTAEARTFIDNSTIEVGALKTELQTAIETANTSLGEFDVALETGIVAANLAEKLEDFESTNNSRLLSAERQLADIANDVAYYGASPLAVDNAPFIQAALDKGGIVRITKPGDYYTSTLFVGDNTTIDCGKGVRLVLKDGTQDFLIVNKGEREVPKVRNKNIHIKGGQYHFNSLNNPKETGYYRDGVFIGVGILLHGIDGLKITDIEHVGGATKYAFLIADVTNVTCDHIHIENGSDGLHFQPPCQNIKISNITGWTDDNFIAFTTGDYNEFAVSENGNGENIVIENIYCGTVEHPVNGPLRIVGAGLSGAGYYDNLTINNVVAITTEINPIVQFISGDQNVPNDYLYNTWLKKVKISNIQRLNAQKAVPLIEVSAKTENLIVENLMIDLDMVNVILKTTSKIKNIHLRNITCGANGATISYPMFQFGAAGEYYSNKVVTFDNVSFEIATALEFIFLQSENNSIQNLNFVNSNINFISNIGTLLNYKGAPIGGVVPKVNISNSTIMGAKNTIKNEVLLSIANTKMTLVSETLADLASIGKLRVLVASSQFNFIVANLVAPATLSYNGLSAMCKIATTNLTPVQGDVANVWNSTTGGELFHYYNAWRKLSFT